MIAPAIQTGGGEPEHPIFPLHNPLKKHFYHQDVRMYNIYAHDKDLHRPLIIHTIGSHLLHDRASSMSMSMSMSTPLHSLAVGKLDYVIDTEQSIAQQDHSSPDLRFICSLYSASMLILAPNGVNIIDLGDISHYTCIVTVAVTNDHAYGAIKHVLSMYPSDNVQISKMSKEEILERYGSSKSLIFVDLACGKNNDIRTLTDKVPSHLVSMRKVNSGSYYVTDSERPLYVKHPYLRKGMVDIIPFKKYYPQLTQVHNRDIYYPTVKSRYVLLTNRTIPDSTVQDLLHKVLFLMGKRAGGPSTGSIGDREQYAVTQLFKGTTVTDISHLTIPILVHPGAAEVYKAIGLHDVA
jgi:hypothetical protein